MSVNIAQVARTRHTTKAFDPTRKIPQDQIDQLREVLRLAPSSVNSQPWHFVMLASDDAKLKVAGLMQGGYAYNAAKVRDASHVMILCARADLDADYLGALLEQEDQDGRFATPEAKATQGEVRGYYVNLHREESKDVHFWAQKQTYLALGALLLAAGTLAIDACPMEGFDGTAIDAELGLAERGLASLVMVALGYSGDADFNAALPKSRFSESSVFTDL